MKFFENCLTINPDLMECNALIFQLIILYFTYYNKAQNTNIHLSNNIS